MQVLELLKQAGVKAEEDVGQPQQGKLSIALPDGTKLVVPEVQAQAALAVLAGALASAQAPLPRLMRAILQRQMQVAIPLLERLGLQVDVERRIIVLRVQGDSVAIERALQEVFPPDGQDVVVRLDEEEIVIMKSAESATEEEVVELCNALVETVRQEGDIKLSVGVGETRRQTGALADSYQEAQDALSFAAIYRTAQSVCVYSAMLMERFLQEIPRETRERYHHMLFQKKYARLLNDEMQKTIDRFLACNLNLSEAARQLYIHRNTLVYRLDKLQKATGLDLRRFDDALLYRLLHRMGNS